MNAGSCGRAASTRSGRTRPRTSGPRSLAIGRSEQAALGVRVQRDARIDAQVMARQVHRLHQEGGDDELRSRLVGVLFQRLGRPSFQHGLEDRTELHGLDISEQVRAGGSVSSNRWTADSRLKSAKAIAHSTRREGWFDPSPILSSACENSPGPLRWNVCPRGTGDVMEPGGSVRRPAFLDPARSSCSTIPPIR
jgi:hypothetical protein